MTQSKSYGEVPIPALAGAIHNLHACAASWIKSVQVKETFRDETVWEGEVQVFSLSGHPAASRCYAWSHETSGGKRKFYAVVHQGPVDSTQAAVRAAIVAEYRNCEQ